MKVIEAGRTTCPCENPIVTDKQMRYWFEKHEFKECSEAHQLEVFHGDADMFCWVRELVDEFIQEQDVALVIHGDGTEQPLCLCQFWNLLNGFCTRDMYVKYALLPEWYSLKEIVGREVAARTVGVEDKIIGSLMGGAL